MVIKKKMMFWDDDVNAEMMVSGQRMIRMLMVMMLMNLMT